MKLEGKVVLVSGANRGIGKALVQELLNRNVKKVYAAARNPETIKNEDERVQKVKLDITEEAQVSDAVKLANDIEVLINNAGVAEFVSAFDAPLEKIKYEMDVNYYGTLSMMRAFIPSLEKQDGAVIANVCSIAAFINFPYLSSYCASKAALFSLTQGLRLSMAQKGIRVHSINPGPIDTDMGKGADMEKTSPEETAIGILNGIELEEEDIFPDPIGKQMFELWRKDYKNLEAMVLDMSKAA